MLACFVHAAFEGDIFSTDSLTGCRKGMLCITVTCCMYNVTLLYIMQGRLNEHLEDEEILPPGKVAKRSDRYIYCHCRNACLCLA